MKRTPPTLAYVVLLAASACGSNGPPPRVAEVPIDEGQPRVLAPATVGGPTAAGGSPSPGASGDPVVALGGGAAAAAGGGGPAAGGAAMPEKLPAMLPTMRDVPAAAAGANGATSSKPLPPKAERLTQADCNKIMDKYIELVGISQGLSPDSIGSVMPMLRNSVSGDPNYTNALGACVKENTKTQYRCAMKATDVDAWKQCLQ